VHNINVRVGVEKRGCWYNKVFSTSVRASGCLLDISTAAPVFCFQVFDVTSYITGRIYEINFHSCTVHIDTIESFVYPTDAQIDCSKTVKICIKIYMRGAATCFGFSQPLSGSYCMCYASLHSALDIHQ
jgi:hypothetical protein